MKAINPKDDGIFTAAKRNVEEREGGAMPQTPTILRQRIGQAERVGARVWEP